MLNDSSLDIMNLNDYFERVYILNLPYKQDRRERLGRYLKDLDLARQVTWQRACSGDLMPPPVWWKAGNGAWGCLLSHARLVQDALMDGLENYLVLEDDAVFQDRAGSMLRQFMQQVPEDWDQLYLGGQHLKEPASVDGAPFVLRAWNVNRTHAYALKKSVFVRFHQHIMHAPDYIAKTTGWHIDHQLGLAHERADWTVYTPLWWIAGQDADWSNISGKNNPRLWWHPSMHARFLPFIHIPIQTRAAIKEVSQYIHAGNNLRPETFQDIGLSEASRDDEKLRQWLSMIAREAMDMHRLPAWQHKNISPERVASLWEAGVKDLWQADLKHLIEYPWNELYRYSEYQVGEQNQKITYAMDGEDL